MDSSQQRQYLQIPEQNLSTLSFCEPTARQLNAWVSNLPMANIGETARQLYHAVIEFNQLRLADASRYDLLELVRNPIHYVCNALNRRYLSQSIVLDENQRKIANLSQALQTHLATGYKIIINNFLKQGSGKAKDIVAKSIHRAMSDIGPSILRSYQLYLHTPRGVWHEVHQLYQIAVAYNLTNFRMADEQNSSDATISIQDVYARILLVGTCQPNQLHQRDLTEIYKALEVWASHVQLDEVADEKSTLLINPESDSSPVYRHLMKPQQYSDYMGLNTAMLVRALHQSQVAQRPGTSHLSQQTSISVPPGMATTLVHHLVQSWGGMKQRAFSRTPAAGIVEVAVGLIPTHFHLSGGIGFYRQLYQGSASESSNPFLTQAAQGRFEASDTIATRTKTDIWEDSFDAGKNLIPHNDRMDVMEEGIDFPADAVEEHPKYEVSLINTSPRGYCLRWSGNLVANVQTGEIVTLRSEGSASWNLGVIRWMRQSTKDGAQLGIELIAPNAQPIAVRTLNKTGQHGDFMRGLLVPEIKSIGQAASLVVPRMPFQVGNKVGVTVKGTESKYQLIKKLQGTSTFNQFQIRSFDVKSQTPDPEPPSAQEEDGFESLWRKL